MSATSTGYRSKVFNIGQQIAVKGAFELAGYAGPLVTLKIDDPTERIVQQVLGCKVWIMEERADLPTVPFE